MSKCIDKRYETLLYAYELGMLDEQKQIEMEIHLLECFHCNELAQQFKNTALLLRHNKKVVKSIRELSSESPERKKQPQKQWFHFTSMPQIWRFFAPVSVATVIVLLVIILGPWNIDVGPVKEAIAVENDLAIMYFENMVDENDSNRLADIATNLLITDLSESDYIKVVSSQKLFDAFKLLGYEDTRNINNSLALEVAQKTNARLLIKGNILNVDPEIIITTQLINAISGHVESSHKVEGEPGEDIFSIIDRLSVAIKGDLNLPLIAEFELDRKVSEITTHSPEAYRNYLEGIRYNDMHYLEEANDHFKQAINIDSSFTMAYYYLSFYGSRYESKKYIDRAKKYIDKVGRRDKYFISSRAAFLNGDTKKAIDELKEAIKHFPDDKEAYYQLALSENLIGNFGNSINYSRTAILIDPLYKPCYNIMAYAYINMGKFIEAIEAIDHYISIAPNEANPYDSKGDIYLRNRMTDKAIEFYEKAIKVKPDFYPTIRKLARLYLTFGSYEKAEDMLNRLASSPTDSYRVSGLIGHAYCLIYQGKFIKALAALDSCITAENYKRPQNGTSLAKALVYFLKSKVYNEKGDFDKALIEFDEYIKVWDMARPDEYARFSFFKCMILANGGKMEEALQCAQSLKQFAEKNDLKPCDYYISLGYFSLIRDSSLQAIEYFKKVSESYYGFNTQYLLGRAYLESNQPFEAANTFISQEYIYSTWSSFNGIWDSKMFFYMGRAYEESGDYNKARSYYQAFLETWKNADPGIVEIDIATKRLDKLNIGK